MGVCSVLVLGVLLWPLDGIYSYLCVCVCVCQRYTTLYIHFRDPEPEPMNQRSRVLNIGLDHDSGMYGVVSTLYWSTCGLSELKLPILLGLLSWSGEGGVRGSFMSLLRVRSDLYSVDCRRLEWMGIVSGLERMNFECTFLRFSEMFRGELGYIIIFSFAFYYLLSLAGRCHGKVG